MKANKINTRSIQDILNVYNQYTGTTVKLNEIMNPPDIISMDVPLFIRMLEWAKEDAQTDMQLHAAVEKILHLNKTLTMSEYSEITNV
jgi:hypothetical protein